MDATCIPHQDFSVGCKKKIHCFLWSVADIAWQCFLGGGER